MPRVIRRAPRGVERVKFPIRVPASLYRWLSGESRKAGKSMNVIVCERLEAARTSNRTVKKGQT